MRCKKHFTDCSSGIGVCASCLRERLFILIETQSKDEAQVLLVKPPQIEDDEHRKSDAIPSQILFPRSVSPYNRRRKFDKAAAWPPHLQHSLSEQRFYATPQIGPNGIIVTSERNLYKKRTGKLSILSDLFRSKTQRFDSELNFDTKHRKSHSTAVEAVTASPPSWFSNIFKNSKKKSRLFWMRFPVAGKVIDRGNRRELDDECDAGSSGYSTGSSKETPIRATPSRRRQNQGRGLAFCLSPLVRPSPNRSWNQKGMPPEAVILSGEVRVPAKPHISVAASFQANRSRKLADMGKFHTINY